MMGETETKASQFGIFKIQGTAVFHCSVWATTGVSEWASETERLALFRNAEQQLAES